MAVRKRSWNTQNGRSTVWLAEYWDRDGTRHAKQFSTKREADAWHDAARHEIRQGIHIPERQSMSVDEACDRWIDRAEREGLERTTLRQYRSHVSLHIKPLLGSERLMQLTAPQVEQFRDDLLKKGRSRALVQKVIATLRSVIKEAQRRGQVAQNVAALVSVRRSSRDRRKIAMSTQDEIRLLIEKAPERWKPLVIVAAFAGLRLSELRGLRWEDIEFDRRELHVRQRADEFGVNPGDKLVHGNGRFL